VIWAPETSAIVQWAQRTKAVLVVTDPDPMILMKQIKRLKHDAALQVELGRRARECYEKEFSPAKLQRQFMAALNSVM
jgi:TPP-dependent indolepyruvate ferredoxin oxidoreductase alpha subunit